MRISRLSYTFPIWIMVFLAVSAVGFAGCQSTPTDEATPVPSRAASEGMTAQPGAAAPVPGGK